MGWGQAGHARRLHRCLHRCRRVARAAGGVKVFSLRGSRKALRTHGTGDEWHRQQARDAEDMRVGALICPHGSGMTSLELDDAPWCSDGPFHLLMPASTGRHACHSRSSTSSLPASEPTPTLTTSPSSRTRGHRQQNWTSRQPARDTPQLQSSTLLKACLRDRMRRGQALEGLTGASSPA